MGLSALAVPPVVIGWCGTDNSGAIEKALAALAAGEKPEPLTPDARAIRSVAEFVELAKTPGTHRIAPGIYRLGPEPIHVHADAKFCGDDFHLQGGTLIMHGGLDICETTTNCSITNVVLSFQNPWVWNGRVGTLHSITTRRR